jgi:hypothetical protein
MLFGYSGSAAVFRKIKKLIHISSEDDIPSLNFRVKNFFSNKTALFLLIFIMCDLGVRSIIFFAGVPFSGRYFIPFSITLTVFAAAGIFPLSEFLSKTAFRFNMKISPWKFFILILAVTFFAYSAKALLPHFDKPFLKKFGLIIRRKTPDENMAVILTNKLDERFGYYGGTDKFLQFYRYNGKWFLKKKVRNKNASKWISAGNADSLKSFIQLLKEELASEFPGQNNISLFVIIRSSRNQSINKHLELFEKYSNMQFIKSLPASKGRSMNLYELHLPAQQ